jgi:hypothetical protein
MPYKDPKNPENIEKARASRRKHYYKNKEQYIQRTRDLRARNKEWLKKKKDVPCTDCHIKYHSCVMDFDHVRGKKKDDITTLALRNTASIKTLEQEADKCEVVCSNCHRMRTLKRRGK